MKCLLITSYFPPTIGGSSQVYGNLHKYGLNKISVLTAKYDKSTGALIERDKNTNKNLHFVNYLQSPNIHCKNIFHSLWALLRFDIPIQSIVLFKTLTLIYTQKINIICIGDLQMQGWLVLFLKKITRTKTILFIHGEELTTTTSSRFFGKNAKLYLHKTDGVIAVSEFTKNMIHETYGISHNKIQLISNGIDLVDYQPCLQANDIAKKFIAPNRTLIFAVGRLIERKGFDNAIEAINLVKNKSHNVHYVIAGIGEMHNTLTTKINNLGLESTVTLIGKLSHEELSSFYQYCDIFLMPNRQLKNGDTEGFGLVFLEANAFNKPVIGGNYGGAVDAIKHGKTGLLVDSKSTVEIANAVIKLIDNPNLRNKLGSNGKLWAKENNVKIKVNEFLTYCDTVTNLKQSK